MENLIQGRAYQIKASITGESLLNFPVRYVMPQELKKNEVGIWETFFDELNEDSLYRVRIPQKRITNVTDDSVFSQGELVKIIVWKNPEDAYTLMVANWAREVEKIRGKR